MASNPLINLFDRNDIELARKRLRLDPAVVRRLRNDVCKHFLSPSDLKASALRDRLQPPSLEMHQRCDSEIDGASKLLFRTRQGLLLEAVILRIATGRTTLCISSQVGCAAACSFCATGKMGIARNLTVAEILDQVITAGQVLKQEGRTLRNIVFMGMGEPHHNESTLHQAISLLTAKDYFDFPPSRILVSSVGVADAMIRCGELFPQVHQALSLHSVRQEVRERLIPLARKYPLDMLRHAIESLNALQDAPVMVEYLLLDDVNDSDADARLLIEWLAGLKVHVNLIPFNSIDSAPELQPSQRAEPFSRVLKAQGLRVTTRYSLGRDIAAACGQLVQAENRRIASGLHAIDA